MNKHLAVIMNDLQKRKGELMVSVFLIKSGKMYQSSSILAFTNWEVKIVQWLYQVLLFFILIDPSYFILPWSFVLTYFKFHYE